MFEIPKIKPFNILNKIKNKITLGFDPKLFTEFSLKLNFKDSCNLVPINNNLIDEVFNLKNNYKIREFYYLNKFVAGEKIATLSLSSEVVILRARIGPLDKHSNADLWKNIFFFSKDLSIPPNTCTNCSASSINTGVL